MVAQSLIRSYTLRSVEAEHSARSARAVAASIVFITVAVAYTTPSADSALFIVFLVLLVVQCFETVAVRGLLVARYVVRSARGGIVPANPPPVFAAAAGIVVRRTYFVLFLCFDIVWLLHSYVRPIPAGRVDEYLGRLAIGPIPGIGFVLFTMLFWAVYGYLYLVGAYYEDAEEWRETPSIGVGRVDRREGRPETAPFGIRIRTYRGETFVLRGYRMPAFDRQPLILWPGFFQNGFVYDLEPGRVSLAEYLWRQGFDLWIIHSRGTASSGGRGTSVCLDDYAAEEIPAVIDFVAANTGRRPIYVGHSQGGITAILSMMGAVRTREGGTILSDDQARRRQESLKGLVTIGSFPDFNFSRNSGLKDFALHGLSLDLFGRRLRIVSGTTLLALLSVLSFVPVPVPRSIREDIVGRRLHAVLFAPLTLLLDFAARLGLWEFLYHIPNVDDASRRRLFYRTMDGTFHGILTQFFRTVRDGAMRSFDRSVNYSAEYHRLRLPVSFVSMEFDSLADPVTLGRAMFASVSSTIKFHTVWRGMGHEDHFMNPNYFPHVLEAIRLVDAGDE